MASCRGSDRRWMNCSRAWRVGSTSRLLIEKAMPPAGAIPVSFVELEFPGSPFTDNANSTLRWI